MHAIAPHWKAAKVLEKEIDVNGTLLAIHSFINKAVKGKIHLDSNSAIIIDEAGMLGSRMTNSLLEISVLTRV